MSTTPTRQPQIFLTAEWRYLAMLNYEIDPALLVPMVPAGTELDSWNGKTFLSLVGFLFRNTRISGIPIPFHRHFEEVNLRFYVRRKTDDSWRRGVVFIKEIAPKKAVAFVARTFYNENYIALPMRHRIERNGEEIKSISYHWQYDRQEFFLRVATRGEPQPPIDGSLQEFITEHYWGYATQRDDSTKEYRVEHPCWNVWETDASEFHGDVAGLYGNEFCKLLDCPPSSAFLADGSHVKVYKGAKLLGTRP